VLKSCLVVNGKRALAGLPGFDWMKSFRAANLSPLGDPRERRVTLRGVNVVIPGRSVTI